MKMFNDKLLKENKTINSMVRGLKQDSIFNKVFFMFATILFLGTVSVFAGNIIVNEDGVQASFYSENGSEGLTETFICMDGDGANRTLIFENGLLINASGGSENSSSPNFPSSGLISYWDMDESSGTVIDSLNVSNGTNNGATPNVAGKINTAYDFDGVADDISLGSDDSLFPTDKITVSSWIKVEGQSGTQIILSTEVSDNGWQVRVYDNGDGTFDFASRIKTTSAYTTARESVNHLNIDTWYFVVMTWDGSNIKLYINGTLEETVALTGTIVYGTPSCVMGDAPRNIGLNFDGILDEVGIWNRTLTSTEISDLYNSGDGLSYP